MTYCYRNKMTPSVILLGSLLSLSALANEPEQSEEYTIGAMVKSLDNAIKHPSETSLATISLYGTDSRYYVMIRGWLVQELQGVNSQLSAYRSDDEIKARLQTKSDFLTQAIRRIDLE